MATCHIDTPQDTMFSWQKMRNHADRRITSLDTMA
jgi:hypothetical protein